MQLTNESLMYVLLLSFITTLIYNFGLKTVLNSLDDYFEPKLITSEDFERITTQPNPCNRFKNVKLIFTLPPSEITPAILRLSSLGCFDDQETFFKILNAAFDADNNESLIYSLITIAYTRHSSTMGWILYNCAIKRCYNCIEKILEYNPLTVFDGKNVIHIAALLDDNEILELASKSTIYLHLRDEAGEVPSKYIQSQNFYNSFLKRNNFEVGRLPYPKEHQAHLDYLHESVELGFTSTINQRIGKMFIDPSPFKFDAELSLKIPRESIFKYSYEKLHLSLFSWYTPSFYGRFFISFENEAAIDMAGVK